MSEHKQHKMKNDPTGEADAVCTCGSWRVLGMGTTPQAEPPHEKKARIRQAFQAHLDSVSGTRGGSEATA